MEEFIVSRFADMIVDVDYVLCVPSVHAKYQQSEIVIDYGGNIRTKSADFPKDKEELLLKWVSIHTEEILENHRRRGYHEYPLLAIEPMEA